ncbi:hypothetical protein E2562_024586 [Oryza meyeriana var. granulata]|uniref:Uncharacterized protein n=1 Tax=Oryza meyeriana var. granulata TaxID=110450 RepID=A0A6G1CSK8_9ORYZ|nr:hypothetical protein E2562_024586 [Oryza meyeriana var. granulata]
MVLRTRSQQAVHGLVRGHGKRTWGGQPGVTGYGIARAGEEFSCGVSGAVPHRSWPTGWAGLAAWPAQQDG